MKEEIKVEGIYEGLERVGQELLLNWRNLPPHFKEQFFRSVPEDFDLQCFSYHVEFVKDHDLKGFSFINLKPRTFLLFYREVLSVVNDRIVIELREDWMEKYETKEIARIRKVYPFSLSLDDFGTGASNFDRIRELRPNFIKLDFRLFKAFPKELSFFVKFLRKNTDAVLIAEGVETREDFELTRRLGIEWWSGFYEKELEKKG